MPGNSEATVLGDTTVSQKLSPTLFIGIGGTGKEVLLRLRRRILQTDWNGRRINRLSDFPVASFLYFDLDLAPAIESDRNTSDDPLAETIAFDAPETMQQKLDAEVVINNLARYRYIKEWWPAADVKSIDVTKGAGQVRALSRMSFFLQASEFRDRVRGRSDTLLQNITNQAAMKRLGLETSNTLRIVVVASAAGGTGSGSFIDVGLMLRSEPDPKPGEVDLYLLLPGGFTGKNADRVQANSYAALMELEHTMRPASEPRFTERWNDRDAPTVGKPFDDVYLLDTRNIVGENTGNVADIYNMIADVLFEDFGSSEFADRKRSVAVNQEQWKLNLYYPDLPEDVGGSVLGYSRGYSTVGQATLDSFSQVNFAIDEARAMRAMIDTYFGIGDGDLPTNVPTILERDAFMREHLHLEPTAYTRFPEREVQPSVSEFALVDELLARSAGMPIDRGMEARVESDINDLLQSHPKPEDWADRLDAYRDGLRRDVDGSAAQRGGPPLAREIEDSRRRIMERWRSASGLRTALYTRIDNKERGGLDYTIQLIQMLRVAIEDGAESVLSAMSKAESQYGRLSTIMLNDRFDQQLNHLRAAAKRSFFNPSASLTQIYAQNARDDLKFFVCYRARQRACIEAQNALRELLSYMGEVRAPGESGQELGTGLVGEFLQGRNDVKATRAAVDFEIRTLGDSVTRRDAMYQVIDQDKVRPPLSFDRNQVQAWANQAFEGYDGSRNLFPALRKEGGQIVVLNALRASVKTNLAHLASSVPSLIEVLNAMGSDERHRTFQELMRRAMPYLNANFSSMKNQFNPDQFKIFVAVRNADEFVRLFGADLRSCLPSVVSANREAINFVEASVAGRMVVLCELSGIPLDVIGSMKSTWRTSYNLLSKADQPLPLHGHKDVARFPHPVVPDDKELTELRERMKLLLQGVVFGLVSRMSDLPDGRDPNRLDHYVIEMGIGHRISMGSERVLRSGQFVPAHREQLEKSIRQFETKLQPIQILAAAALFRYTALRAYAKKPVKTRGGQDDNRPGLMHVIALGLQDHYRRMYDRRPEGGKAAAPDRLIENLYDRITEWTKEIVGSIQDADPVEVNIDPDDHLNGALPKRRIDPIAFEASELRRRYMDIRRDGPPPPPPPSEPAFHVALDGQDIGPQSWEALQHLANKGKLVPATLVWNDTLDVWTPAGTVDALRPLMPARRPPQLP